MALSVGPAAFAAVINGTPGDDNITGTATADTVWALGGNDVVHGAGGGDVLHGGPGADTLNGDAGFDSLRGDSGADTLSGAAGSDKLFTFGDDVAYGGDNIDQFRVGAGDARVYGDGGNDQIIVFGVGNSVMNGGAGGDQMIIEANGLGKVLNGGEGDDSLFASSDGPTLNGGVGDDNLGLRWEGVLAGGIGDDMLFADDPEDPTRAVVRCGAGFDHIEVDLADEFGADCEDVTVIIQGDDLDNTIVGTAYSDDIRSLRWRRPRRESRRERRHRPWRRPGLVDAGAGDDTVFAYWGSHFNIIGDVDDVVCGSGNDTAYVDDVDTVSADCETVHVFIAPKAEPGQPISAQRVGPPTPDDGRPGDLSQWTAVVGVCAVTMVTAECCVPSPARSWPRPGRIPRCRRQA